MLNVFFRAGIRTAERGRCAATCCRGDLRTTGKEFASGIVIRASKWHLDILGFPIACVPPQRHAC